MPITLTSASGVSGQLANASAVPQHGVTRHEARTFMSLDHERLTLLIEYDDKSEVRVSGADIPSVRERLHLQ